MVFRSREKSINIMGLIVAALLLVFLASCSDHSALILQPETLVEIEVRVSELDSDGLYLQLNEMPAESVKANGLFTFSVAIPENSDYEVAISRQPEKENCIINRTQGTAGSSEISVSCDMDFLGTIINGNIEELAVSGEFAFYTSGSSIFAARDNGTGYDLLSSFDVGNRYDISSITSWNNLVFISQKNRIVTLDYTDPYLPVIVDSYQSKRNSSVKGFYVHNGYGYAAQYLWGSGTSVESIEVFRIEENGRLVSVNNVRTDMRSHDIDFSNNLMAVAGCTKVTIFDVSNPESPSYVSTYDVDNGCALHIKIYNDNLAVSVSETLELLDFSNVETIERLASIETHGQVNDINATSEALLLSVDGVGQDAILKVKHAGSDLVVDSFLMLNGPGAVAIESQHVFFVDNSGVHRLGESDISKYNYSIIETVEADPEVTVSGSYAYVQTESNQLSVYNLDQERGYSPINQLVFDSDIHSILTIKDHLYVFEENFGVRVFDILDRVEPVEVSQVPIDGSLDSMHADSEALYIAKVGSENRCLLVTDCSTIYIDVSNPLAPQVTENVRWFLRNTKSVVSYRGELLTVGDYTGKIRAWPTSVMNDTEFFYILVDSPASDIASENGFLYSVGPAGFFVYDSSDASDRYSHVGSLDYLGGDLIVVLDGYAYVSSELGIVKIDVSKPDRPREVSVLSLVSDVVSLSITDGKLLATSKGDEKVHVIDTEVGSMPSLESMPNGPITNITDIEVFGEELMVNIEGVGLDLLDISNFNDISTINRYIISSQGYCAPWLGSPFSTVFSNLSTYDNNLYLSGTSAPLLSLDIASLESPKKVSFLRCQDNSYDTTSDGRYAVVRKNALSSSSLSSVEIFDLGAQGAPSKLGDFVLPRSSGRSYSRNISVISRDEHIYAVIGDRFYVVDTSLRSEELVIAQLEISRMYYSNNAKVFMGGDDKHIFISSQDEIYIISVEDQDNPSIVSTISIPGFLHDSGLHEGVIYANTGGAESGVYAFDVSQPTNPVLLGLYPNNNLLLHDRIDIVDGTLFSYGIRSGLNAFSLQ